MAGAAHSVGGESPSEQPSRVIECSHDVIEQIRTLVLERFNQLPHGGGEIHGVLWGSRENQQVSIAAFRALAGYELGSSPALSEEDRAAFAALLAGEHNGDELAALEPVGWFRSHPRSELDLTERDRDIFNRLFPEAWQVAMVLRPGNSAPTRVRFYFRSEDGALEPERGFQELTLPAEVVLSQSETAPQAVESAMLAAEDLGPLAPPFIPPREAQRRRWIPSGAWLAALLVIGAGLALALFWLGRPPQPLALRVLDSGGQLRITWNRSSPAVRNAQNGHLEIIDGSDRISLELDAGHLHNGNVTYTRRSGNVTVRLAVTQTGAPPAEEVTRFLGGPAPESFSRTEPTGSASREQPAPPAPEHPAELAVPVLVEIPAGPGKPDFKARAFASMPEPPRQAAAPELAPPPAVTARNTAPASLPQATRAVAPPVDQPAPPPTSAAQNGTRPQAAVRTPAAPASGRLIWIGRLQKNEVLTISGKNASSGTIVGELPGKPVKFSVSPGDLSSDGIVLYTSNLQYANSVVEPGGPENGWNKTTYTWNPRLANDVIVQEGPGPQNGWSRIAVRSKSPKISVIVIDWALVN